MLNRAVDYLKKTIYAKDILVSLLGELIVIMAKNNENGQDDPELAALVCKIIDLKR